MIQKTKSQKRTKKDQQKGGKTEQEKGQKDRNREWLRFIIIITDESGMNKFDKTEEIWTEIWYQP